MKLNTFTRLVLVTVLIAFTQCSKLNRIKSNAKSQDGEGSWDQGFLCPHIEMGLKGKESKEQGAGKFFPKNFVDAQVSNEDKLGLVIEFSNEPAAIVKTKVGVKISGNKYYIPYRFFSTKIEYNNGWFSNKYLQGNLVNDDGEEFTFKILLPYKATGWYISDDEAHKVSDKIVSMAVKERSSIQNIKGDLLTEFSKLQTNKPLLETTEKNFANLEKALEENKKALETNKKTAETLTTQIADLDRQILELQAKIKPLEAQKESLTNDQKVIVETIANSEKSVSEKSGGAKTQGDALAKYKPLVEASNKKVDELIADLTKRAPEKKTPVITPIKTAITDLKQKDLIDNLKKIRSI